MAFICAVLMTSMSLVFIACNKAPKTGGSCARGETREGEVTIMAVAPSKEYTEIWVLTVSGEFPGAFHFHQQTYEQCIVPSGYKAGQRVNVSYTPRGPCEPEIQFGACTTSTYHKARPD